MSGGPCTGRCCAAFTLTSGYAESTYRIAGDKEFMLAMLIPLSPAEATARIEALGFGTVEPWDLEDRRSLFTCRHFDGETKRCREYARRPSLCRVYPDGYDEGFQFRCMCCGLQNGNGERRPTGTWGW